jgi:hypothetical protein
MAAPTPVGGARDADARQSSEHTLAANQAKPEGDHQDAERTVRVERRQQCCAGEGAQHRQPVESKRAKAGAEKYSAHACRVDQPVSVAARGAAWPSASPATATSW